MFPTSENVKLQITLIENKSIKMREFSYEQNQLTRKKNNTELCKKI